MKSFTYAALAAAVLFASPSFAADAPPAPQAPTTAVVQLSMEDMQVILTAVRMAASQCGDGHEDGCAIGAHERVLKAKLSTAAAAMQQPKK